MKEILVNLNPRLENEDERLEALRDYQILDSSIELEFDRLTELASLVCDVPISLISLIDKDRQWFKSNLGLNIRETPRELAFCQHAILDIELFEIEDATRDERFMNNDLVLGEPHIRFYAGQPLVDSNGFTLGTICVIDQKPKTLNQKQKRILELLAKEVMALIFDRRQIFELKGFERLFHVSENLVCIIGNDGILKKVNPAFELILDWKREILLVTSFFNLVHPDDKISTNEALKLLEENHRTIRLKNRIKQKVGEFKTIHWDITLEPATHNYLAIGKVLD